MKDRLVEVYDPIQIYLFGSYAWGHPDTQSDIDLLIVVQSSKDNYYDRALKGYDALMGFRIANDILVYTKDELDKHANDVGSFLRKIQRDGRLIYAKS